MKLKQEHQDYVTSIHGTKGLSPVKDVQHSIQTALLVNIEDHLSRLAVAQETLAGEMLSGLPELPTKKELNIQDELKDGLLPYNILPFRLEDIIKQTEVDLLEDILKDSGVNDDGDLDINTMKDLIVNLIKDNKYIR